MKTSVTLALTTLLLAGAAQAQGRFGRWADQRSDRFRNVQTQTLGNIQISFNRHTPAVLNIPGYLQCSLTHIKLQNYGDSARITDVEVVYQRPDRYGNYKESITLRDDDDYGRGRDRRGRGGNSIDLSANESTPWLDVDDVQDGFPNGRCITALYVYGVDTPDRDGRGRPGRFDDRGRPGFGGPSKPVLLRVDGASLSRQAVRPPAPPIAPRPPGPVRPTPPIRDNPPRPPAPPPVARPPGQITCESNGYGASQCYVGLDVRAVDIKQKLSSKSQCNYVQVGTSHVLGSYAFDSRAGYIYVHNGCRAVFNLHYR